MGIISFDSKEISQVPHRQRHAVRGKFRVHFQEMNEWSTHLGRLQANGENERKEIKFDFDFKVDTIFQWEATDDG